MSQVRSDTPFMKKLKEVLKIKPRVKNKDYSAKTGTKEGNRKFAEFRVSDKDNKKLQKEAKDPSSTKRTYKRVTSENKKNYSDQQKVKKDEKKKKKGSVRSGYVRYKGKLVSTRTAQGKKAANRLKAKSRAQEMAKKRLANK